MHRDHERYRHQSKMSSSKRLTCKGIVTGVYLCEAPWPTPHKFRGSSNFVGSEAGQIKSVKLLQIWSPTGLNTVLGLILERHILDGTNPR